MASLANLIDAIRSYDADGAQKWAAKAMQEGLDPVEALKAVAGVMKEIGDLFGSGELWLPDLIGAADAAQAGLAVVEDRIATMGLKVDRLGTVVIGTVFGDIHNIGKAMVTAMLSASGFRVVDLGTNVPSGNFVGAVKEHQADILAMSALLTTTAAEQQKVIQALKEAGVRDKVRVMVGGGAITAEFAQQIGADGYGSSAMDAVALGKELLGQ